MTVRLKASACIIAAIFLIGCSSSDDDDEIDVDPPGEGQTSMPDPSNDPDDPPVAEGRFNGNYLVSCRQAEDDEEIYETIELTIQGDSYSSIFTRYSDAQCTQSEVVFTLDASPEFPGGTADTQLGIADFVDFTTESSTVNGELSPIDEDDVMDFDLILLDGNSLFFGLNTDMFDGETAETRPVEIDVNTVFVLQ